MVAGSGGGSGVGVLNLSIHNFHFAVGFLNAADFVLFEDNANGAILHMLTHRGHGPRQNHIAGPQAGGGVHVVAPGQHFVDGFAQLLGETLGLVGELTGEELVAVLHHEVSNARVTQQHADPRLGVPSALLDDGVGEAHRVERRELVVAGGDFLGGTDEMLAMMRIIL